MSIQQNHIKTTIEFDQDLFYMAKAKALEQRRSFKEYINELVAKDIVEPVISKKAKYRYDQLADEIENNIGVFQVKDVDDMMKQLDE